MYTTLLGHFTKNSLVEPNCSCIHSRDAVVPLITLLASCDFNTDPNGMYDMSKQNHVAPDFSHLDLRSAVVSLMVLSTLYDADISALPSHDTKTNAIVIM